MAPDANGVVAATTSTSGVFPNLKVHVRNGMVTHVEGGGKYKEVWDGLLRERWIPDVPGINVSGDYKEYARNPLSHVLQTADLVEKGTYRYLQ
ncbi:MAG: hypothetical protein HY315_04305 [Acidobacteria bacterium]|nr:hypothetical protein [Acidobacteriota bacterium]